MWKDTVPEAKSHVCLKHYKKESSRKAKGAVKHIFSSAFLHSSLFPVS